MRIVNDIKLGINSTIKDALQTINNGGLQIAIVVDENDALVGTVTDGDIRRGLLNGLDLNSSVSLVVHKSPSIASVGDTKESILKIALAKKLHKIPLVDELGKLVGIEDIEDIIKPVGKTNRVILMVGGLGTRLRPLTQDTPKPMLKVGNKPILQTIVDNKQALGVVERSGNLLEQIKFRLSWHVVHLLYHVSGTSANRCGPHMKRPHFGNQSGVWMY